MPQFKAVKDDLRAPAPSNVDDAPILALLNKGKTVFVTEFEEADFRRLYSAVKRDSNDELRLRRKARTVDGEAGHVIWTEPIEG
jgi:hypothetical protein